MLLERPYLNLPDDLVRRRTGILVVQFGQSNALTHALANTLTGANTSLANAYSNVQTISQQDTTFGDDPQVWQLTSGSIGSVSYDAHTGAGPQPYVGFEITMMRDLDQALPSKKFGHCRIAIGGAKSTIFDPAGIYPTSPPGTPNVFSQIVTFIQSSMPTLGCSSAILVWEQGEADAKNSTDGDAYAAWLEGFIDALRSHLGNVGPGGTAVPFVFGKLNADADPATYVGLANLRASQVAAAAARSRTTLVSQDSIPQSTGMYDGTHYNGNGYAAVGHLFSPAVAAYAGVRVQPVASFTDSIVARAVTFTDTSVSYGDTITAWHWDFGDSNTSSSQNPSHTYGADGTYNVTLTVTNSVGDTSSTTPTPVSVIGGFSGVTRDATSGWYVPANATEWATFLSDIGLGSKSAPDMDHGLQEASGNAADSIGSFTLTAVNTPSYQQAVTGWSRKAIKFADNTAKALQTTSASLPDISTTSMLTLTFMVAPGSAPSGDRGVIAQGTSAATRSATILRNTGKLAIESTTSHITSSTSSYVDGAVHVVAHKTDRTNSVVTLYTELEKVSPTFGATMTGKGLYLGTESGALGTFGGGFVYEVTWSGAHAEWSDADMKTLIQGLTGLTVPWS